jgi:hypothetical protein
MIRWVDLIKMDLTKRRWDAMDWIHLALDRDKWWAVVSAAVKLRVPLYA